LIEFFFFTGIVSLDPPLVPIPPYCHPYAQLIFAQLSATTQCLKSYILSYINYNYKILYNRNLNFTLDSLFDTSSKQGINLSIPDFLPTYLFFKQHKY